jgi:hypothetical protein
LVRAAPHPRQLMRQTLGVTTDKGAA